MSCLYFHRQHWDPDDSTESSDSITYWRKLLVADLLLDLDHALFLRYTNLRW
jgi:hypothetical protein